MKTVSIFTLIVGLFLTISCSKENVTEKDLINSWHLIEVLNDPGDASGIFQKVESDAIIQFFDDNTVSYSNSFCSGENASNSATYSTVDNKIYPDCNLGLSFSYKIQDNRLIIYYNCIEGCAEKFELIK
ncbi:hypothetical protein [Gillisia marina]|uniref:hypothetical protein n=1 Tax=Gillisia marina TaxID=1167637 RepID=UPI00029AAC02|nr:hypothetical protein [Gillisia marina]